MITHLHGLQMRTIIEKLWFVVFYLSLLVLSSNSNAEIYRWVDDQGRVQFSDSPNPNYQAQGLTGTIDRTGTPVDIKRLQSKAQQLKEQRLTREKKAAKRTKAKRQKQLRYEKKIAKAKKQKEACKNARIKEDLAFRQRSKSRSLTAMRKALERYEKKRMIRINRCQ